jgi:chemotaxis protein CheX
MNLTLTMDDLVRVTQELWGPMLNLELTQVDTPIPAPAITEGILACVHIDGRWVGSIRLHLPVELARLAAAAFLGMTPAEVTDDQLRDCAGELANITAGSIKRLVPSPSKISLPSVAEAPDEGLEMADARPLVTTVFEHQGHKYTVTVLQTGESKAVGYS